MSRNEKSTGGNRSEDTLSNAARDKRHLGQGRRGKGGMCFHNYHRDTKTHDNTCQF